MDYILGIDQGATKTMTALADLQGNILSCGKAPGGCHAVTGLEHAVAQIKIAAENAVQSAGAENDVLIAIGAGITGVDFPSEYTLLQKALQEKFSVPSTVVNDCMVALRAESTAVSSMIICGGTGLNIGILAPDGSQFTFGYYIDDCWQGGASIGQRTIQMIAEADVGIRPHTLLTKRILEYFGEQTVDGLLEKLYTKNGKENLKFLVPIVMDCVAIGDQTAKSILEYFSNGCSRYALAGLRKYDMLDKPITVYLSGGIFKNSESLLNSTIASVLQKENPKAKIVNAEFEPVVGGVMLALEKVYGGEIPGRVVRQVRESAYTVGLSRKVTANMNSLYDLTIV